VLTVEGGLLQWTSSTLYLVCSLPAEALPPEERNLLPYSNWRHTVQVLIWAWLWGLNFVLWPLMLESLLWPTCSVAIVLPSDGVDVVQYPNVTMAMVEELNAWGIEGEVYLDDRCVCVCVLVTNGLWEEGGIVTISWFNSCTLWNWCSSQLHVVQYPNVTMAMLHVSRSERRKIVTSKIIVYKLNQLRYMLLLKLLNLKLFALPFNSKCLIASCSGNLKVQTFDKHKSFNYYISMTQCDLWPAPSRNHS